MPLAVFHLMLLIRGTSVLCSIHAPGSRAMRFYLEPHRGSVPKEATHSCPTANTCRWLNNRQEGQSHCPVQMSIRAASLGTRLKWEETQALLGLPGHHGTSFPPLNLGHGDPSVWFVVGDIRFLDSPLVLGCTAHCTFTITNVPKSRHLCPMSLLVCLFSLPLPVPFHCLVISTLYSRVKI